MSILHPGIFYIHLPTLFRILKLHLFTHFHWKRLFSSLMLAPLFLIFASLVIVGRLLDEVLFFGYRSIDLSKSLFVVSNPRSGTTFMHRLLCEDKERHQFMKLYHTLLPSVTLIVIIEGLGKVDKLVGGPLKWVFDKISDKAFGGWKHIHPMGFNMAEEDEGMFVYTLLTPGIFLMFPFVDEFPKVQFCDELPEGARRRLMKYYESSLKRFMFATGQNKVLVSKNVLSTGRLKSLVETIDGIKIVYIIRDPYKAVPSLVNMFYVVWKWHSPDLPENSKYSRQLAEVGMKYYTYFDEMRSLIPAHRLHVVHYDEFIKKPAATVREIYEKFDLPVSAAFDERLIAATQKSRKYKSSHQYSLEMFGLTQELVYSRLKPIFAKYGFEKPASEMENQSSGQQKVNLRDGTNG